MAVGFDIFLEGLVIFDLSRWKDRRAQAGIPGLDLESFAIHVISIGDDVADFRGLGVAHFGGKLKGFCRFEKVAVGSLGDEGMT